MRTKIPAARSQNRLLGNWCFAIYEERRSEAPEFKCLSPGAQAWSMHGSLRISAEHLLPLLSIGSFT